ncbi:MSCRAMM family adhesin [Candidatus Laterigemmans baculatus]|uniref:hypothetical protein n=1 Tax=Candidatus Laterigemmans baculatus TaxID=2770505 RepID=UPI0013DA4C48|nr:hypothetical protein [Candidatus Laterigemmans baculatus]
MQSAACPRCAEPVRIPAADPSTTVRCPWCQESFELREALASLPPMLEVVGPEVGTGVSGVAEEERWGEPAGEDDFSAFAASLGSADVDSGGFPVATHDSEGAIAGHSFGDSSIRRSPQRRSRPGSPFRSLLKMAAGGVAGIVIALLILQYLGRLPDLGVWPFRGPNRGLWGQTGSDFRLSTNTSERSWQAGEPPRGWQPTEPAPAAAPSQEGLEPPVDLPLPDFDDLASPANREPEPANAPEPDSEPEPNSEPDAAREPEPISEPVPASEPNDAEPSPDRGEPAASSLEQAVARADESWQQYEAAGEDASETHLEPLVDALAGLGSELVDAGRELGDQRERIDALVDSLAADRPLLKQLLAATNQRIAEADGEAETGAVAIGQFSAAGDELLLKKSASDATPLRMHIDDPQQVELPREGAIVLVLGKLQSTASEPRLHAGYIRSLAPRK